MKTLHLTIIAFLCHATCTIAQSITTITVSSADNLVAHPNFSVSSTWGDFMAQTFTHIQTTNNTYSIEKDETSISVYPNPSLSTFYVDISGSKNKESLIALRDVFGKEYYSKVVLPSIDKDVIEVNPENQLAAGVYFVIFSNADNVLAKKIVINK